MSTQVIETPGGIAFSGFYYPELLREILSWLRENKDYIGLTDENDYEVHVQLVRAFCLMGHLSNTRLDTVATEAFFDSAKLLESVKQQLRLVAIELNSATPAVAALLAKLSEVTTLDQTGFIPALAEFSTSATPPIIYEASSDGIDLDRTDRASYVYGCEKTDEGTAGQVVASAPDTFVRTVGIWGTGVNSPVGDHLFLRGVNSGEYRVTERLNDTQIKVIKIPSGDAANFVTDTGITWFLRRFTADYSVQAHSVGSYFSPLTSMAEEGDLIYIGNNQIIITQLDFTFDSFGLNVKGVWEYFDNEYSQFNPDSVTDLGSTLEFDITTLLGSSDRSGAEVIVTYLQTGATETLTSVWSGSINKITTTGLLGQVTPSTDVNDYYVTSNWVPFDNQDDGTVSVGSFEQAGDVSWDIPQTSERSWVKTNVNLVEAFWIRFRVVEAAAITAPSFDLIKIDQGDQYMTFNVTQGETIGPQIVGSSTGQANQEFELPETPYIDDSETIEVDEGGAGTFVEYEYVTSFLYSKSTDRHYRREVNAADTCKIIFGSGVNGKVPPAGINNIRATYRVGGDVDGNVGENQIVVNSEGVAGISDVTNPKSAYGWRIKDGGNDADLERIKREKPSELTIRGTASRPEDIVYLAVNEFTDSSGTKPVARAWAIEEGFGIKTVKLLVVGTGGTTLTTSQIQELEEYFNGDRYAIPPVEGVLTANYQVIAVNFEPATISVAGVISWTGGSSEQVKNKLLSYLTPLAKKSDETTYVWNFGEQISFSQINSIIHSIDPNITDIPYLTINGSASSYNLSANELPVTNSASLTFTIQDS